MAARDYYIDRIRVLMTALVVFHHTAITYGGAGGWFYREVPASDAPSSILLTLLCATDQAYFMGLFFFLAGYHTPGSLDRKGTPRYLLDRFVRLGIPLLAFGFLLAPVTIWLTEIRNGHTFGQIFEHLWRHRQFENGPLWFAQALLILAVITCGWRGIRNPRPQASPVPPNTTWLIAAVATGAAALAIRQFSPVGENHFGLQLGYFASYIVLFALGIEAWRHDWLTQLNWIQARRWGIVALIAFPMLPASFVVAKALHQNPDFAGGFTPPAILYAFWEPFLAWGIIATMLVWFREKHNRQSAAWDWAARRAYAVFVIHPLILVAITLAVRTWQGPALLKFAVAGTLTVAACWAVADILLRIPLLRRIL